MVKKRSPKEPETKISKAYETPIALVLRECQRCKEKKHNYSFLSPTQNTCEDCRKYYAWKYREEARNIIKNNPPTYSSFQFGRKTNKDQ